jgi:hypothetical protein
MTKGYNMAKRLSNRDMLTALYNKFCVDRKSPMDSGGKTVVVAGEKYVIPDNWQSFPPPGWVDDGKKPGKGKIFAWNPQTKERIEIAVCEGSL